MQTHLSSILLWTGILAYSFNLTLLYQQC
jgi:hypothetical protein